MSSQKGFTLIEGLFILLILSIVGFAGYFVWNSKNEDQELSETSQNATGINSVENTVSDDSSDKYLAIKEWGVKIPLTQELNGAYYTTENGYVYLQFDVEGDEEKRCSNQAALTRATDEWLASEENFYNITKEEISNSPGASQVDGVWYYMTGPNASCTDDQELQDKAGEIRSEWVRQSALIVSDDNQ